VKLLCCTTIVQEALEHVAETTALAANAAQPLDRLKQLARSRDEKQHPQETGNRLQDLRDAPLFCDAHRRQRFLARRRCRGSPGPALGRLLVVGIFSRGALPSRADRRTVADVLDYHQHLSFVLAESPFEVGTAAHIDLLHVDDQPSRI